MGSVNIGGSVFTHQHIVVSLLSRGFERSGVYILWPQEGREPKEVGVHSSFEQGL